MSGSAPTVPGSCSARSRSNDRATAPAQLPRGKPRVTTPKLGVKRQNAAADASDGAAETETCPGVSGQPDSSAEVPARYPRQLRGFKDIVHEISPQTRYTLHALNKPCKLHRHSWKDLEHTGRHKHTQSTHRHAAWTHKYRCHTHYVCIIYTYIYNLVRSV